MEMTRGERIDWIDHARGLCVVLVVMLYATEWVQEATGRGSWLDYLAEFARPFRMPDLFLISGLLLSRTIGRPWAEYFDRKVVHFAYFYVLWLSITFALLGPLMAMKSGWETVQWSYLHAFVRPFYWLWFIYMLPFFFVATKLGKRIPVPVMWIAAVALHIAEVETGVKVADRFAQYYVFFYSGYAFAGIAFRLARVAGSRVGFALAALGVWAILEAYVVFAGYSTVPGFSLALAFVGIAAIVAASALMSQARAFDPLRYCGEHSIVIYLAFFAPAMAARVTLTKSGIIADIGTIAALVTLAGILGALALYWIVRNTRIGFLFERPRWAQFRQGAGLRRSGISPSPRMP